MLPMYLPVIKQDLSSDLKPTPITLYGAFYKTK